jgi:pyruvate formate lyase activating enzyme
MTVAGPTTQITGTIFDIMKYSIRDGPGIRTTVFFKGCPLNCWWCHNPESQAFGQEMMVREDRCIGCGACLRACRHGAIIEVDREIASLGGATIEADRAIASTGGVIVETDKAIASLGGVIVETDKAIASTGGVIVETDKAIASLGGVITSLKGALLTLTEKCRLCGDCVKVCHSEARVLVGREATSQQLMEEIEKDLVFYEDSGGGVTFSGGEPLAQPAFLKTMLEMCRRKEIHTAVDTTGFGKLEDLLEVSASTDLFLYDLKLIDESEHRRFTGVSNKTILENLRVLSRRHSNIIIRIPIIPGVNDSEENLRRTGEFLSGFGGVREVNLLPYHKTGVEKYRRLRRTYSLPDLEPLDHETMKRMAEAMRISGKPVTIQ